MTRVPRRSSVSSLVRPASALRRFVGDRYARQAEGRQVRQPGQERQIAVAQPGLGKVERLQIGAVRQVLDDVIGVQTVEARKIDRDDAASIARQPLRALQRARLERDGGLLLDQPAGGNSLRIGGIAANFAARRQGPI